MSDYKLSRFFLYFSASASICFAYQTGFDAHAQPQPTPIVIEDSSDATPPPVDQLVTPQDMPNGQGGESAASSDDAFDDDAASIAGPSGMTSDDNEAFFDAENLVPQGEMGKAGPIKVNPKTQPGSKLVIVHENAKPDSKSAQLVAAERALSLGLYDSALDMFDALYKKNKKDKRVLMGRALTLQRLGRFEDAMRTYQNLLDLDPHNVDVRVNMLGLLATKYPSVALRRLLELKEKHPDNVGIVAQLAITEARVGDYRSAMKHLGVAASMEPKNATHLYNMAVIADRAGETAKAIGYYEKALEVDSIYDSGRSIPRDSIYERLALIR